MSMSSIRFALLQINPTVGDLEGNFEKIRRGLKWAEDHQAAIAITPELALTGYPPEDLLLRKSFLDHSARMLKRLTSKTRSTILICGHPSIGGSEKSHNSATALQSGRMIATYQKIALPNYGVFDELRYFSPGDRVSLIQGHHRGRAFKIALSICEDLWPTADGAFFKALGDSRPDVILNLSASPYEIFKPQSRLRVLSEVARRTGAHVAYVNLVGGQDELIFDGRSLVVSPRGRILGQAAAFSEDYLCVDVPLRPTPPTSKYLSKLPSAFALSRQAIGPIHTTVSLRISKIKPSPHAPTASGQKLRPAITPGSPEDVLTALELSIKDYAQKNGFTTVGVAMSGGIDSALVAAIAVRALGRERVIGATLPSKVTSRATLDDAKKQALTMGIRFFQIPIGDLQSQFLQSLSPIFAGRTVGSAEENLQARIRGTLMMALSNHLGFLLLATGNKSEFATGYCTLYGDMAGGFAPLKDLTKSWVYRVARVLNRLEGREIIPASVLRRAPTAELRPGQKDQDTLPPYPVLDSILEHLIQNGMSCDQIKQRERYSTAHITDTARRLYQNEHKRRQSPPGPKITSTAFGRDRRMPISQKSGERY